MYAMSGKIVIGEERGKIQFFWKSCNYRYVKFITKKVLGLFFRITNNFSGIGV